MASRKKATSVKKTAIAVACATCTLALYATTFTYEGHWPDGTTETETEVVIPDGTTATIANATDVAAVARLTSISFGGSGAKVEYTASSALALSASVSGTGKFSAISSGDLTLSGNNSGLVSPGCFFFSNTAVTVASRYGLGSTGSAQLEYHFGSKVDPLHFTGAGLTNDVPLRIYQGTATGNCVIGPDNANETLVFRNDFVFNKGDGSFGKNCVWFRNKVRFQAGTFGPTGNNHIDAKASGGLAEVWFEEDSKTRFFYFFSNGDLRYHLNWSDTTSYLFVLGWGTTPYAVCEQVDVLSGFTYGVSGKGTFDLNGLDQSVKRISKQYGNNLKFTSATPATLTMTVYDSSSSNYTSSQTKFSGKVNFTYAPATASGAYTLTGSDALSDSSGTLTVGGAGHLVFASDAGWSGTNVVVQSGATLELNSAKAMTNTLATLTVEDGGHLVLHEGAACTVKSATIAGTPLDAGETYKVEDLKKMDLPVDGDDNASITIAGGGEEWTGWPTTPGAVARVPADTTIYVSDDDVATIEALGGIRLALGASVICTNLTQQLDLSAPVSGPGTFKVLDSDKVVLSGDNSDLLSPGCFFFSNTAVTVASRYGLGSTGSATLHHWFGDKTEPLLFVGEGLTNDAPIRVHQGTQQRSFVLGPTNANETLVICNDFLFDGHNGADNQEHKTLFFRNNVRIRAGTFGADSSHLYTKAYGDAAEVWFESGSTIKFYLWFAYNGNVRYHAGWGALAGYSEQASIGWANSAPYLICEGNDVFPRVLSGKGTFDLNGFDQTIRWFSKGYGNDLKITSESPATLSVTRYDSSSGNYTSSSMKFSGNVNFTYAPATASGAYTLTGSAALSDSTGALTVGGAGRLAFANGAGWLGTNVTIRSGATLSVDATSMPVMFGNRALLGHQSWTKLEIESGGTLELAAADKPAVVRSFVYNGQMKPAGRYTSASGVGITGGGALYVRSSTDGEPGAMVIVY